MSASPKYVCPGNSIRVASVANDASIDDVSLPVSLLIPITRQKELFSFAFVHAVAAATRSHAEVVGVDVDSIDIQVKRPSKASKTTFASPIVDFQLKCTAREDIVHDDRIAYPLPIKNYNDLREEKVFRARVLLVVLVPEDVVKWVVQSEDHLQLLKCGYYVSMRGMPSVKNIARVTVDVPRANQFCVASLTDIMDKASENLDPDGKVLIA
jgi:hypothetical protein